ILRAVEFMPAIGGQSFRLSLSTFGRQRRNLTVLRINDQRRTFGGYNAGSAIPPEIIVCTANVRFRSSIATIHIVSLQDVGFVVCSFFVIRKEFFARKFWRPFHGRDGRQTPNALKIRLTVWSTWQCGFRNSLRFWGCGRCLSRGGYGYQTTY